MIPELASIGLDFPRWQDALEATYASGLLHVAGQVRDGQVLQYNDPSGARLVVMAVEPYGSFASFSGGVQTSGHISMVDDIIGVIDVVADSPALHISGQAAPTVASLCANIVQGPMLVDSPVLEYQPVEITALATDVQIFTDPAFFAQTSGSSSTGVVFSEGLEALNSPSIAHHAAGRIAVETSSVVRRHNELTGQSFWVATVHRPFDFSVVLPESVGDVASLIVQEDGTMRPIILSGLVQFTASIVETAGCGGGSCGSGGCGCGGH